ncbi:glycoside hydrolase family 31 protein [Marinococcus sp. PL1-022]|uniref:glycoside hydrolase family 31 protein n=1 Tax=Marinococcus sp. PL1-022 TaxID=3095363 RepID=UPI0029C4B113|nr:glycoside hydrolase family 31 protein [Marinococcus sp. PL1-022]MDX6152297.1 glycoside hydrolase family 31 protein [Marinococcus sp. PL1-022]
MRLRVAGIFTETPNKLEWSYNSEHLIVEAWGKDSVRVRGYKNNDLTENNWALIPSAENNAVINIYDNEAWLQHGKINVQIKRNGKLTIFNHQNEIIVEEYVRNRNDINEFCSALDIDAREFRPLLGGDFAITARFESNSNEKIYGMGQYQQPHLDLKYCSLELAQRNSQATIPFSISSKGYGFLWNNPAVGNVTFGKNITEWKAESSKQLDYWVTIGETPHKIVENYTAVTGRVPMMPEYGLGFWQCKLRYQTQEELLNVAREYYRRGLPLSVIVVDYFHWPHQGDWRFDEEYWPDPQAMVKELKEMGIELMVSIWPTVDTKSENFEEMMREGHLIQVEKGIPIAMDFMGNTLYYDATDPSAREYVWNKAKKNYYDLGIETFWLDEAEPEYSVYDFDNYRYHIGPNVQTGNYYPVGYAQTFYEGMNAQGQEEIVNLLRCAWAGSQKYGALVWSGDIDSSFEALQNQFAIGLNMGMSGIPWWTTDIGGFHGGNPDDPDFRECIIRWFQYGAFCPVFRLHGDREPKQGPLSSERGGMCPSGADNEVWSYGEEAYEIFKEYMQMRENLKPYIRKLMEEAHENGAPVMRALFYEFPDDPECWENEDSYMFGSDILVSPILNHGQREKAIYFPLGEHWRNINDGELYEGGKKVKVDAPIHSMPVFVKVGSDTEKYFK